MMDIQIERLPFYWRLSPKKMGVNSNVVDDYYPFSFGFDSANGLVVQKRNQNVLAALECIYKEEYNIGYLQDGNEIAKPYGNDFISFLFNILKKNTNIKKILEIGCGGCIVLDKLNKNGYDVYGMDSSPFAAAEGRKKGIDVITDFFPSSQLPGKFDMIFHVDVLEHIDDYPNFLTHQYEQLNDDGLIVVNVPDATDSIMTGDISMAMHQHLNYFTVISLSKVLINSGFEVLSINKAGYGGSLYAVGKKKSNKNNISTHSFREDDYEKFTIRADKVINSFGEYSNRVLSNRHHTLGLYVPLRSLPYISKQDINGGFRFFDDTNHWHMNYFDGVNVPIENFNDLKQNPVTDMIVMSLTFGDVIRNKIIKEFGDRINVVTIGDLISQSLLQQK